MRKASKILTLILIVVFAFSVFAGCDLIGRDVAKYRNAQAIQIGNETITIGKLLDTYNNYYNQYYYYISAGYFDAEYLFEMALESLIRQSVQIDDYVTRHKDDADVKNSTLIGKAHNAEYLTAEEFEYAIKYVRYLAYTAFDSNVEDNIASKYELNDPETEDTSRDFAEYDDIKVNGQIPEYYAQYYYQQNFDSKDADEYFEKYYFGDNFADTKFDAIDIDGYVYDLTSEYAQKRVDEFNDRMDEDLEEDEKLTVEEYIEIQRDIIKQYRDTIKNNYGIVMEEFFNNQLNDMVAGCIVSKWTYEVYEGIEKEEDFESVLTSNYVTLRDQFLKDISVNDSFDSFITGLSDDDLIYTIPQDVETGKKAEDYVFVKNVLIPFNSVQTNLLNNLANTLGTKDSKVYTDARDQEATRILADYYYSDKYDVDIESFFEKYLTENEDEDSDSKYEQVKDIFTTDEQGKLIVNSAGILGEILNNGVVTELPGKTKDETIIELMKRFNTDVGQHSSLYDYVVYVGNDDDYKHNWVDEFVQATKEALDANEGKAGGYALGVSDYGVHIVYVVGFVSDYTFEFNFADRLKTETASYRLFKTYFESQVSLRTTNARNELLKTYLEEGKISLKGVFSDFLEENNFEFDFDEYVAELKREL